MALKNKYQREKQQYSNDSGRTWIDVSPANYRRGRLIEAGSEDCNTVEWKEVTGSWFCIGFNETQYRWVDSGNFECHIGDKYPIEQEEISNDGGSTWTPTGETRFGKIIRNSSDCPIAYNQEYLTIEILDTGNSDTATVYSNISGLEYRVDNGEWQTYNGGIVCQKGSKIQWRGNLTTTNNQRVFNISDNATYQTFGNINSVYDNATFTDNCYNYENFFYNSKNLLYADNLILPATTLAQAAYKCMFNGCTSLAKAPVLPATTLAIDCYCEMFKGCAITTAPALPATKMYQGCYYQMFGNCKQLVNAPQLPATELADGCYMSMFHSCWALQTAPSTLPATTLYESCYQSMFQDCKNLLTAPELPATTLADYCYAYMFWGCTLLSSVPATLPATELRRYCYEYMFQDCISLTGAPVLPATTFRNPAIVAEVNNGFAMYAYNRMFSGCTRLQYIKAMFASIPDNYTIRNFTSDWVYNVASTGTFVQNGAATWHEVGKDGVPSGWTVVYDGARWITVENEYICNGRSKYTKEKEQISSDGGETWTDTGRTRRGEIISETSTDCSKWVTDTDAPTVTALNQRFVKMKEQLTYDDGETWEDTGNTKYVIDSTYVADFDSFKNEYLTVEVNDNMTTLTVRRGVTSKSGWNDFNNMMARGVTIDENGATYSSWIPSIPSNIQDFDFIQLKAEGYASGQRPNIQSDAPYKVFGNINSLFASDSFASDTTTRQVLNLFYHSNVEDAENVYSDNSYSCKEWFYYCDKLVKAPKVIYNSKYYEGMFQNCTSLTKASRFAGSDVGYKGFTSTFSGCTKLIEARIDTVNAYSTSLDDVRDMFSGVTTNGTLYVPSNSPFITGTYVWYTDAVPQTWTTVTE